ncbi:MAG: thiamine-binding protein [Cyanobacteria bacterium P01_E01_bin.48]
MLVEFSILPLGDRANLDDERAVALAILEESGLPYQVSPCSICVEGPLDEVMEAIRSCHNTVMKHSGRVVTNIRIEDDGSSSGRLTQSMADVCHSLEHVSYLKSIPVPVVESGQL